MRRTWLFLFLICIPALALRLYAVARYGEGDIVSYSESGITANNWVTGKGYTFDFYGERPDDPLQAFMPPTNTGLIAFSLRFFANPALGLEVIQAVLSTLTVIVIFFVALDFALLPTIAYLTALAVALYPVLAILCAIPTHTTLNLFLLATLLLASLRLLNNFSLKWSALTGILLGINLLGRPALVGLVPLLLFWVWLNSNRDLGKLFKTASIIILYALLILVPWIFRNYQILGRFGVISTNGGFTFWQGNNPFTTGSAFNVFSDRYDQFLGLPHNSSQPEVVNASPYPIPKQIQSQVASLGELELDQAFYRGGLEFIRDNPAESLSLTLMKFTAFWWFDPNAGDPIQAQWRDYYRPFYSILLVMFLSGILLSLSNWRRYLILYALFLYNSLTYTAFNVVTRYRWEIEPFFLIFAALTLTWLFQKVSRRSGLLVQQ